MLENIFVTHSPKHTAKNAPRPHAYLKVNTVIEGLSINSLSELLLKTIFSSSDSYYYKTNNQVKIARALAQSNPSLQNLVRYGRLLDQNNLCAEAIEFFEKALLMLPEDEKILFEIYKFLGNAYLKMSDVDSAEENYNKAYTLNPRSSLLQVNFGTLAIQRGEWHMVQFHFREALKFNINQDRAWTGLAIYHNYMGDLELALANLKKALDLSPDNRTALLLLTNWWPKATPKNELVLRLTQYLDLNPEDQDISILLIQVATENRDFHIANIEIEKLVCLDPKNILYHQMRYQIYEAQNESKSK